MQDERLALIAYFSAHLRKFALCDATGKIRHSLSSSAIEIERPEEALEFYLGQIGCDKPPQTAIIAVSAPVIEGGDLYRIRSNLYPLSRRRLQERFGFERLIVKNSFSMNAYAFPYLAKGDFYPLGEFVMPPAVPPDVPRVLIGLGEGLGTAILLGEPGAAATTVIPCEGGQMNLLVFRESEHANVVKYLVNEYGARNMEDVLCSHGIENIYSALCQIANRPKRLMRFLDIIKAALQGDEEARHAVNIFFEISGIFAGNMALMTGALGGVYFINSSGIMYSYEFLEIINSSGFRRCFELVQNAGQYLKHVPTYAYAAEGCIFIGLSHFAASVLRGEIEI